eukprot:3242395-Pleurochrysis_carterae.AAC.1
MCGPHKKGLGTVIDWIGGRYVCNGGFGCLTAAKRARAALACAHALSSSSTRSEYEKDLGFLAHVRAILGVPAHVLNGAYRPLE